MLIEQRQQTNIGFSLVELLIALIIASIVALGLLTIFTRIAKHSSSLVTTSELRQTLNSAMHIISNDIRRSGYWAGAQVDLDTGANTNPFMASNTDIFINGDGNCILLAYDANKDSNLPNIGAGIDDERYGFRLRDKAIQSRPTGAVFNCNAVTGSWDNLTNPNVISITSLNFTSDHKTVFLNGGSQLIIRNINITITGHLINDPAVAATITKRIRIRNSKFVP